MRKVVRVHGETVDLDIPLMPVDRRPVPANCIQDLRLFLNNEIMNSNTVNAQRATLGLMASLITIPFVAGPELNSGPILMSIPMMMMIIMSGQVFLPAREIQYNQMQAEASLGLITAPSVSLFLTTVDDILKMCCVIGVVFSLFSIWWDKTVTQSWPNGGGIWGIMVAAMFYINHDGSISTSLLFSGVPLAFTMIFIMLDMIMTFYVSGVFSPESGILPANRFGFLAQYPAAMITFTGAGYPPWVQVHFPRMAANVSFGVWTILDVVQFTGPLWTAWLKKRAIARGRGSPEHVF
jgi:hypothetical protein